MEFYQVRYFLSLCETLNFTRAAEQCHISQPSLTRAIKLLEADLGGPLFHRERNHTHLTELGRMMRPYLEQVHRQTLEAQDCARRLRDLKEASLRVGIINTGATTQVMGVFEHFQKNHPDVELTFSSADGDELIAMLSAGDVDTALYTSPEVEPAEFHALTLTRERIMVGFGRGHPLEDRAAVSLKDLHGERYLVCEKCPYVPLIDQLLADHDVSLSGRYRSDRDDLLVTMAAAGFGFCFLPEGAAGQGDLAVRPLVDPELAREMKLLTVRGRPHSAALGALVREASQFSRKAVVAAA